MANRSDVVRTFIRTCLQLQDNRIRVGRQKLPVAPSPNLSHDGERKKERSASLPKFPPAPLYERGKDYCCWERGIAKGGFSGLLLAGNGLASDPGNQPIGSWKAKEALTR